MNTQKFNPTFHVSLILGFLLAGQLIMAQSPVNDDCNAATLISIGNAYLGTTTGATLDNVGYCQTNIPVHAVH